MFPHFVLCCYHIHSTSVRLCTRVCSTDGVPQCVYAFSAPKKKEASPENLHGVVTCLRAQPAVASPHIKCCVHALTGVSEWILSLHATVGAGSRHNIIFASECRIRLAHRTQGIVGFFPRSVCLWSCLLHPISIWLSSRSQVCLFQLARSHRVWRLHKWILGKLFEGNTNQLQQLKMASKDYTNLLCKDSLTAEDFARVWEHFDEDGKNNLLSSRSI